MIKHFATCTDDYPEKPKGELYQAIVEINIGTMENPDQVILQCSDCGAFETKEKRPTFSNLPKTVEKLGERINRRDNKIERLERRIKKLEKQVELLT